MTLVPYLSDEWLALASDALADLEAPGPTLHVGYRVAGGPAGTSEHHVTLGGPVAMARGLASATVVFELDYDLAVAIARGTRSAQRAFLDGDLQVQGDVTALLGRQVQLATVDERVATLRDRTRY